MSYTWPGNIRELQNVIERAVILSDDGRLLRGLDSYPIIDRRSNPLPAAEVAFRRLNGNMPQKELDLFQLSSRSMA
jgi:transcriptional regulator of acetoin/glycerol metabolism